MPSNFVSQIDRIVSKIGNANDPLPGQSVSSGTGAAQYGGQVGARVCLGNDDVQITNSSSPTLYGGIYQYVLFYSGATATPAQGLIAFWRAANDKTYQVTNDEPTGVSDVAGICLNAVSKGSYGWIQIAGKVQVLYRTVVTKVTPAIGDLVLCAAAGAGADVATADILADATNLTSVQARHILGIAVDSVPAVNIAAQTLGNVRLSFGRYNF
jgi:hypothetical protein